jgi:shikimate kinase
MNHLFLIGFMGAGKSTVARILGEMLARPVIDLDDRIEAAAGQTCREIFESRGEDAFRHLETAQLERLSAEPPSVVACGGGIVVVAENRAILKRLGRVAYLRVSAGETLARLGADETRPLLSGPSGVLAATSLLEARESLYSAIADITVDTVGHSPQEVARSISDALGEGAQ